MEALGSVSVDDDRQSWLHRGHAHRVVSVNQRVIFWLFNTFGPIWRRSIKNELEETDLVHGVRYVVVSNHQSGVDPFFTCTQLPYRVYRRLGTIGYFTANVYFDMPVVGPVIMRFGSFPARIHAKHPYGLTYAKSLIKRGNTLLIFPEGRRTIRGESPVRHGVEVLAREPNVMIIPMHIEWKRGWPWRTFKLGVGKPFDASQMSAQEIMDHVYALSVE